MIPTNTPLFHQIPLRPPCRTSPTESDGVMPSLTRSKGWTAEAAKRVGAFRNSKKPVKYVKKRINQVESPTVMVCGYFTALQSVRLTDFGKDLDQSSYHLLTVTKS